LGYNFLEKEIEHVWETTLKKQEKYEIQVAHKTYESADKNKKFGFIDPVAGATMPSGLFSRTRDADCPFSSIVVTVREVGGAISIGLANQD
jgi:hypothetical protein